MAEAGILGMLRRTGYLRFYRSAATLEAELAKDQGDLQAYGVNFRALEPRPSWPSSSRTCAGPIVGGMLMPEPVSVADPGAVVKAYARLFEERGGRFVEGDARTLSKLRDGWQVRDRPRVRSRLRAVVVALGPWSDDRLPPRSAIASRSASSAAITCTSRPWATPRSTGRCIDVEQRLCADAHGARASASRRAPSSRCAMRRRRRCSSTRVEPPGARDLPARRARRRRAVARPPAVPARHAADGRPRAAP